MEGIHCNPIKSKIKKIKDIKKFKNGKTTK